MICSHAWACQAALCTPQAAVCTPTSSFTAYDPERPAFYNPHFTDAHTRLVLPKEPIQNSTGRVAGKDQDPVFCTQRIHNLEPSYSTCQTPIVNWNSLRYKVSPFVLGMRQLSDKWMRETHSYKGIVSYGQKWEHGAILNQLHTVDEGPTEKTVCKTRVPTLLFTLSYTKTIFSPH